MHGIVHKALKEYVEEDIDGVDWDSVTERAGLDPKLYLPVTHYPDNEITRAVTALSELSGRTENSIQRGFGQSLAPQLLDTFKAHVRDEWGAQEVLLALDTIYEQLEEDNGENASTTVSTRAEGEAVALTYRSERELCTVLRGIAAGVAAEYDATTMIDESTCLREGDGRCELRVDLD